MKNRNVESAGLSTYKAGSNEGTIMKTKMMLIAITAIGTLFMPLDSHADSLDFYPNITDISTGPFLWDTTALTGEYYRLVITTVEIYDDIYVELMKTDEEGFNREVINRYMIPFDSFKCNQETSPITPIAWLSYNKVIIKVGRKYFALHLAKEFEGIKLERIDDADI